MQTPRGGGARGGGSAQIGIAASDRIESLVGRMGLPAAGLTAAQLMTTGARRCNVASQMAGILLGCVLGMCPLLWIDQDAKLLKVSPHYCKPVIPCATSEVSVPVFYFN